MHVDEVLCHGENGGATWETSHRGCIMRKVESKEVTAGGRFDFFLDSGIADHSLLCEKLHSYSARNGQLRLFVISL